MATTYEPIATTTLGSSAASITLSSIPATYTDLRLVCTALSATGGDTLSCYFNGTTGTTLYSWTRLVGTGTSATTANQTDSDVLLIGATSGQLSTTIPILSTVDILSYAGSAFKTSLITDSSDKNGDGRVASYVGLWRNTSAITSIVIKGTSYNLASGTTATLYGIKAA
jgi:hypothetical protein